MILFPEVKKFIESYIEDIEKENMYYVFSRSLDSLNDVEFNQLYTILQDLPLEYDLDEPIHDIIYDLCNDIKQTYNGEYICIEDEWDKIGFNHLGNMKKIIDQFDDFEIEFYDKKHYCKIW